MSETVQNPRIRGAMLPSFIAAGSSSVVLMTAVAPIGNWMILLISHLTKLIEQLIASCLLKMQ